ACRGVAQRQLLLGCSQSYPQIVWATATGIVHHPARTRGGCSYAGGACMIVGAPPPVRRVKPEHRASRCSHPGRVLLRWKRVLIVGAPPSVRRVKPEHRASRCSHPGRVLLRGRWVLIVGAPPSV